MAKTKDQQQREIREVTVQATNHYNFHAPDARGVWNDEWRKKFKAQKIESLNTSMEKARAMIKAFRIIADNISVKDGKVANKTLVTWLSSLGVAQVAFEKSYAGTPELKVWGDYQDYFMLSLCPNAPTLKTRSGQQKIDSKHVVFECERIIAILDKRVSSAQDCISNYDKYYQMGIDILDIIDRYDSMVPFDMRFNQSGRFELLK